MVRPGLWSAACVLTPLAFLFAACRTVEQIESKEQNLDFQEKEPELYRVRCAWIQFRCFRSPLL